MKQVLEIISSSAENLLPVLIEGEYGSGKQLIAYQIHLRSARRKKAFITLDCRTLTGPNWEEILFGQASPRSLYIKEHTFGSIELAEGGTLYLKHGDLLPLEIQQKIKEIIQKGIYTRLGSNRERKANLRIIASTREDLRKHCEQGTFDGELYKLLTANPVIQLPPLRERKNDILQLAEYFMAKYAKLANKDITGIIPEARNKLVRHDYKLANVKELEQIIERAVSLSSDNQIWTRHLFLGAPAVKPDNWYYNLLKIEPFGRWVKEKIYPDKLQYLTATFFMLIILLCFLGPASAGKNPAIPLVWGIWWPLMFLSFFWVGRSWCSICAYAAYGRVVQKRKHFNIPLPPFIQRHDAILVTAAFLITLWAEEITHMRSSPRATGCLMATMLSIALVCAVVFRRESWCRYLCPMGGLIGVCSMSSVIELRSDTAVCSTQCKKTECYHGTPESPGCPLFQHLLFVDNNQTCKLCLQCIRNCPNQSVSLNLRLPGREIWLSNQVREKMSYFVLALLGSVLPVMYLTANNLVLHSGKVKIYYSLAHFLLPVVLYILLLIPGCFYSPRKWKSHIWLRFWRTSYAYIPLALTAHLAYQMQYLPWGKNLRYSFHVFQKEIWQGLAIQPFQVLALVGGLLFSYFCLWEIYKHRGKSFEAGRAFWLGHAFLMIGYAALALHWLIFR
jgi:polyferredoxin